MNASVRRRLAAVDGNAVAAAANAVPAGVGLDLNDAAYHTAHDYPGGVPALAQRLAMSQHTLAHKVSLTQLGHHLSPLELLKLQEITGDHRVLQAMASSLGYVCIGTGTAAKSGTLESVMQMAKEFGEVLVSVHEAVSDGSVSINEMRDCERQAGDLMAALHQVLVSVRKMMPPAGASA